MVVYILKQDDRVGSLNRLTASFGFAALGEQVVEYDDAAFETLPLERGDIVVGGIGYVRRACERMGVDVPHLEPIPEPLVPFAGRKLWRTILADVRKRVSEGETLFMKPAPDQPKLFTGVVLSGFRDLIATAHLDDALVVDCAEPVQFVSEYRTFVMHGEVVGVRPYTGDSLLFPAADVIRDAISAFDQAPVAYSLDVGVTAEGRTLLVEINDAYALGAYGLFPIVYAKFIAARWAELWAMAR